MQATPGGPGGASQSNWVQVVSPEGRRGDHRGEGRVAEANPERALRPLATSPTSPSESTRTGSASEPGQKANCVQDPERRLHDDASNVYNTSIIQLRRAPYCNSHSLSLNISSQGVERKTSGEQNVLSRVRGGGEKQEQLPPLYLHRHYRYFGHAGKCRMSLLRGQINSSFPQKLHPAPRALRQAYDAHTNQDISITGTTHVAFFPLFFNFLGGRIMHPSQMPTNTDGDFPFHSISHNAAEAPSVPKIQRYDSEQHPARTRHPQLYGTTRPHPPPARPGTTPLHLVHTLHTVYASPEGGGKTDKATTGRRRKTSWEGDEGGEGEGKNIEEGEGRERDGGRGEASVRGCVRVLNQKNWKK